MSSPPTTWSFGSLAHLVLSVLIAVWPGASRVARLPISLLRECTVTTSCPLSQLSTPPPKFPQQRCFVHHRLGRKTKNSFFSSSSKDVIQYIPRGIEEEDVASLIATMLPHVATMMLTVFPPPAETEALED